jgi:hypothetical protein
MNNSIIRNLLISVLLFFSFSTKSNNPENYFDSQYTDATQFCTENIILIETTLSECCIPPSMALSVAFPEMLRYSLWRDLFETTSLELLYVHGGKNVANFSIGWLQMKPSFAETIEKKIKINAKFAFKYNNLIQYTKTDSINIRRERISRLKQFEWQLQYLSAFIDINCNKFRLENIHYEHMLKYLAAAYNRGMDSDINELANFSNTKTFPYGPGKNNPFGFVEVAEYFFMADAKQLFNNP